MWQKSYKGKNGSLLIFYHWTTKLEKMGINFIPGMVQKKKKKPAGVFVLTA